MTMKTGKGIGNREQEIGKQSEQGRALPEGWRWVKLGDVCKVAGGSQPPKSTFSYEPQPDYIRLVQIQDFRRDDSAVYIPKELAKRIFEKDDVMIGRYGPPVFQILRGLSGAYNVALMKATPNEGMTKDYLYFLLQEPSIQSAVIGQSRRAAGQSGVQRTFLESLLIPLPPIAEQKRIVGILRDRLAAVDQARQATQAQLEAAQALPAAYLRQIFNSPEAREWQKHNLGSLAALGPNNGLFKKRHEFGAGVPLINVSDLYRGLECDISKLERVSATPKEIEQYSVQAGDLFFCRSSLKREGIGWCCLVKEIFEPTVFECHIMRIRLKQENALPKFVAYYWQHPSVRAQVIESSRTATMTTMNQNDLSKIEIPLPPLKTQKEKVYFLDNKNVEIEATVRALQDQLNTINALPAALLRQAFNGEL